ncbi:RNA recognition motif domain-containing protein [Alteromonas lipolytica]|uniref:RNA-binding protein n=1 Tax=Alteromonas lipolytica TaxID=1856405 RepID=A0A1E8FCD3_9ALTE|nr:RNA-binding protein [Alteromonas lipolytica]OFI33559.1 RNA-binding protein [Alteromonas lipolytica]GGF58666.1 RNA-binding protein [Alteromonas lipolytica]
MKVSLMQCFLVSLVLAVLGFIITHQVSFDGQAPAVVALSLLISGIVTPWIASLIGTNSSTNSQPSETSVHLSSATADNVSTLYVGNLPYKANEAAVKAYFEDHIRIQSVRLMKDKKTGKRKGYGFIEVIDGDVDAIIGQFNDSVFQDRTLKVRPAKDKIAE